MQRINKENIIVVNTLIMAVVFILSGVFKSVNIYSFADTITQFLYFFSLDTFKNVAVLLSVSICAGEIMLGLLAFHRSLSALSGFLFLPIMLFFSVLTGINYFSPYAYIESCGCFGEVIHMSPLASFIKSLVLLLPSAVLFYSSVVDGLRGKKKPNKDTMWVFALILLIALTIPALSWLWVETVSHNLYLEIFIISSVVLLTMYIYLLLYSKNFILQKRMKNITKNRANKRTDINN